MLRMAAIRMFTIRFAFRKNCHIILQFENYKYKLVLKFKLMVEDISIGVSLILEFSIGLFGQKDSTSKIKYAVQQRILWKMFKNISRF